VKITNLLGQGGPTLSYEFSPPKDETGTRALFDTLRVLRSTRPTFVSVTYGAGGSTRDRTAALVAKMLQDEGVEAMAHLTCVGSTERQIASLCETLARAGVENVLALRGDPPRGEGQFRPAADGFRHAKDLVRFLRRNFDFCLGAACYPEPHPEAPSEPEGLDHLREKVEAGVDFLVTQLFYRASDFARFVRSVRARGVAVPIFAGVFPPTDLAALTRMTAKCGASVPPEILEGLAQASPDEATRFGVASSATLCRDVLALGADGLHFYTRNRAPDTLSVLAALGPTWRTGSGYVSTWTAQGASLRARTV
jgi:methylenetetrahydrofolate reductase (NADPH)